MRTKQTLKYLFFVVVFLVVVTISIDSIRIKDKKNFYPKIEQISPPASTEPSQTGRDYTAFDHWGYAQVIFTIRDDNTLEEVSLDYYGDGVTVILHPYIIEVKGAGLFTRDQFDWKIWQERFELFKADMAVTQPARKSE